MNNLTKIDYNKQKAMAKHRGIDFQLTYEEWLDIWIKSGKADLRGCKAGCYNMGRHNDVGPYALGNVSIIPHEQNIIDANTGNTHALGHKHSILTKNIMSAKSQKTNNANYKGKLIGTHIITGNKIICEGSDELKKHSFNNGAVYACVNGKRKSHLGYTWQRI